MTDNVDHLIIEHLTALRNELREFRQESRDEFTTIKHRVNSLERSNAALHDDNANMQLRLDRVDGRLDRIERRLDLVET